MNSTLLKQLMKTGSLVMIFCFSLSFFFGVIADASAPAAQEYSSSLTSLLTPSDPENHNLKFRNFESNSFYFGSSPNSVNVTEKVYVRSYHRKDGTYVRGHYRRDPR